MTAWTRSRRPSLRSRLETWLFTVASLMYRRPASSALDRPAASSRSTSVSRSVRAGSEAGVALLARGPGRVRANWPSRRRVTDGASRASPAAITLDGLGQLGGLDVLEQEPTGAGPDRGVHVVIEV